MILKWTSAAARQRVAATAILIGLVAQLLAPATALGAPTAMIEIAPPAGIGVPTGGRPIAFAEDEWALEMSLSIDAAAAKKYATASSLGAAPLTKTTPSDLDHSVRSHFIVAQLASGTPGYVDADVTITYPNRIVGVIVTTQHLNQSDYLGADITYPRSSAWRKGRGLELAAGQDWFRVYGVSGPTGDRGPHSIRIHLHFGADGRRDQIRVLTHAEACTQAGTSGANTLNGGPGHDVLCGLGGADSLRGGGGADIERGGSGSDTIGGDYGVLDPGSDVLWGNTGGDVLFPGPGNDRLFGGRDRDETIDVFPGESGTDAAQFESEAYYANLATGISHPMESGAAAAPAAVDQQTLTGLEELWGSPFDDTLIGSSRDEIFFGMGGTDTIRGGGGEDWLNGDDPYKLSEPRDGGINGNDLLYGESGDDWFYGGLGDDLIDGGLGDNSVRYSFSNLTTDTVGETIDLRNGNALCPGWANQCAFGSHGVDHLLGINNVLGSYALDTIYGNGGDNVLRGGSGNDTINGGGGDDLLIADDGADTLNGQAGNDLLVDTCYANDPVAPDAHCTPGADDGFPDTLDGGAEPNDNDVCRHIGAGDTLTNCEIVEVSTPVSTAVTSDPDGGAPRLDSHDTFAVRRSKDLTSHGGTVHTLLQIIVSAKASDAYGVWAANPGSLDPGGDAARELCRTYATFGSAFSINPVAVCRTATSNNWDAHSTQFKRAAGHANYGSTLSCVRITWDVQAPEDVTYSERYKSALATCKKRYL